MTRAMDIPQAPVVGVRGLEVRVSCPYCGKEHRHERPSISERKPIEWRSPGCGWQRSPEDRARGYLIYFGRNTP